MYISIYQHILDVERLRQNARNRSDRAFRHNAPGFCAICDVKVDSTQLWRCPVEWCAVWKGSVHACLEHLTEKHGGSTVFALTNVAKFFPPWTVTRSIWQAVLRPDVSGVAVDALLFHEAGCRLVHRCRMYKDPFPHPALRGGVVPRLLSCVNRTMAIAQLTHLRISVPPSGAPPGQVPADCYPGALLTRSGRLHVMCHSPRKQQCWGSCLLQCFFSPEQGTPTQLVPAVTEDDVITPGGGGWRSVRRQRPLPVFRPSGILAVPWVGH